MSTRPPGPPFRPAVAEWFAETFDAPTRAQKLGWPAIARGESTLVLAPTGSGKTLAAFLAAIDGLMFAPVPPKGERCRVLYVSPLKALAVDVERNLRAPIEGISRVAECRGESVHLPQVAIRTGDTPAAERARMQRRPPDILITTPESLFLILTSRAREILGAVETLILDEIHVLVGNKRGAHLALSLERLEELAGGRVQRIGRASHRVEGVSRGVIFPKYRGDLLASAAITTAMKRAAVEETRVLANPLDVLAQQIVAIVALEPRTVDELFRLVRRAAPFSALPRAQLDGVLDMLAGRYPSDEFGELRPRIVWDRLKGTVRAREGAQRLAVANAGTIPDRGLYGVFLAEGDGSGRRVGELDEEMVFESRVGEVFVLGASSWRIAEITRDRVLVLPAPGEPGKMPFWRADRGARPVELGRAIGRLTRDLVARPREEALQRLQDRHDLEPQAAANLISYLEEQRDATGAVPDDRTIVLERTRDEVGDWRLCLLGPWGGRVYAPWAMALEAKLRLSGEAEVETIWSDDGIVIRLPERDRPPDARDLLPEPEEIEDLVVGQLGSTSLFAAHFREAAGRALLLPRRRPGHRTPLWMQRKKAHDLLEVVSLSRPSPSFGATGGSSRGSFVRAAQGASGAEQTSWLRCAVAPLRRSGNRSSPRSPRRSPVSWWSGKASPATRPGDRLPGGVGRTPSSMSSSSFKEVCSRPPSSSGAFSRPGSPGIARRISTPSWRPGRSSGSEGVRLASVTAASRSSSPTRCPCSPPRRRAPLRARCTSGFVITWVDTAPRSSGSSSTRRAVASLSPCSTLSGTWPGPAR